jgi:ATP-dependent protease ClpP protease subunit
MTNFIAAVLALLTMQNAAWGQVMHIQSNQAHVNLYTSKIAHLEGMVDDKMLAVFKAEVLADSWIPGDQVIIINSLGGYLDSGEEIIKIMKTEKAKGIRLVCAVEGEATSMAFNILTNCDVRLATKESRFLVHKAAIGGWPTEIRGTAKNLREAANELDRYDEPYAEANRKAMHLSRKEYDDNADEERTWFAPKLLEMGYLQGIVKIK